ncbi:MAG: GerMN domain-containing protein [Eubacteriales bacterium]|nr:GerMN domain-containing protein [Eubacteriales bacterium]
MKMTGSQRNLYLLALILLLIAVALACAWTFWGGERTASDAVVTPAPSASGMPSPSAPIVPVPTQESTATNADAGGADSADSESANAGTMSTVVYYQDNYGYLVPVMCTIPYEDGVAKATLNKMIQSPENDMQAARLGLKTVLPEGTTIDLDISDGLARIDLSKEVLNMADAAAESNMIAAIVQALTEFESVERVEFLVDGQKIDKLPHGTDVSGTFERGEINLETSVSAINSGELKPVMLYFPCESSSVVVPVTRMVYSNADVNTAVLELAKGPSNQSPLESALPAGCGLIDVQVVDGVAKVNFTKEFANLVQNTDGGRLALKALVLTCTQFDGVKSVEILVEGEPYDPGQGALSVPSFANVADEIANDYIQTQANLIFNYD